jgi:hypothetical protein
MPSNDEITFVLHGLDADNRKVRASIFVQKLRGLLRALYASDRIANQSNQRNFDYVLSELGTGSALVTIREKQRRRTRSGQSSIRYFETTASAVYNGDRGISRGPPTVVQEIKKLSDGVTKQFSHAEISFADENVIRIDDFLQRQAEIAVDLLKSPELGHREKFYRGIATGSFDGFLKEIDARGTMLRGKLLLSAGGAEVDCVMNKDRIPEARESFDKRVVVDGAAHYDGTSQIPSRIDARTIKIIGDRADLLRWRGAFRRSESDEVDEEW